MDAAELGSECAKTGSAGASAEEAVRVNMPVRLSKAETADLCGSTQRAHQIGFLRLNGIKHYVDAHGWPVVLWCHLDPAQQRAAESKGWKSRKVA